MRSEQLFPHLNRLQNLCLNSRVQVFVHEESGHLEQKLLGGYLRVQRQFTVEGEVLEEVKAVKKDVLLLESQTL